MSIALRAYVFAVLVTAAVLLGSVPFVKASPTNLVVLCCAAVITERVSRVQIVGLGASFSISLVVTLAAVAVLPPSAAALVGVSTSLQLLKQSSDLRAMANLGVFALIPAVGAEVCALLGGHDLDAFLRFPNFLLPFLAAVAACVLTNGMLVALFASFSGRATFWSVWRDIRHWAMPYFTSAVLALISVVLWHDIGPATVVLVSVPAYAAHWVFAQYSREQAAYEGTISALVQAVEIKDHYTRGHSERVAKGAELIARQISMSAERIAKIRYAGLLHDIGKLGVPTRLLAKAGKLTDEEYALLCLHPNQGVAVIRDIRFLTDVYDGILYHHERLDGRGYPSGRKGDEIPEFARILGVADAFDAMTSTRSYRAARPVDEAVAELWRGAGTQFDPELVRAMEAALAQQAAQGKPWQVTDEPVPPLDVLDPEGVVAAGPAFVFEDHDDPMVEQEWHPTRIMPGDWPPVRMGRGEPGVGERYYGRSEAHHASASASVSASESEVDTAAGWEPSVPLSGAVGYVEPEPEGSMGPRRVPDFYEAQLDAVSRMLRTGEQRERGLRRRLGEPVVEDAAPVEEQPRWIEPRAFVLQDRCSIAVDVPPGSASGTGDRSTAGTASVRAGNAETRRTADGGQLSDDAPASREADSDDPAVLDGAPSPAVAAFDNVFPLRPENRLDGRPQPSQLVAADPEPVIDFDDDDRPLPRRVEADGA